MTTKCLGKLLAPTSFGGIAPADLLHPGVDTKPIVAALNANDAETLTIGTPLRVEQGTADTTVFPVFTDQLVATLRKRGTKVTFAKRKGINHGRVSAGTAGSTAWIAQHLKG